MKARNVFALLGLSFAMGAGVFAGVASKKAEEVGAATDTTVYYSVPSSVVGEYSVKCNVNRKGEGNDWKTYDMEKVSGSFAGGDIYKAEFTDLYDGLGVLQFQLYDGGDWHSQIQPISSWTSASSYNGKICVHEANAFVGYNDNVYLVGDFADPTWSDIAEYKMTVDPADGNHYSISNVDFEEGDELKVHDATTNIWYPDGDNIAIEEDGKYTIDFYLYSSGGDHVVVTQKVDYSVHCGIDDFDFVLDDTNKPEGVVHQYKALVDYAYRARELTFFRNGVQITSNIGVDYQDDQPKPGNNIVGDVTNGFKVYYPFWSGMEVYLKTYSDGGISLWANGYKEVSFNAAVLNGKGGASLIYFNIDEDFEPYGDYIKQFKTSSKVKLVGLSGEDWDTSNSFNCGGASDSIHIENVPGNNAKEAFQSDAWTVHNDCEEVIFVKMKSDLSMHMYIGGYVEEHVLTIGGEEIPMVKYDEEQYYATGVNLSAGDEVTSYKIEGVEKNPTSKAVGNNNLLNNKVLVDNASADIYYNVSDNNLYVSGLPLGGYHIYKNGNSIIQMTETDPFGDYTQYKTDLTTFAVGDYFKFIDCSGGSVAPVLFSITKINEGGLGANFEVVGDPGSEVIRCKTACSTAVYMKLLSGLDEVYFGDVPEEVAAAKEYADGFKTAMAGACSGEPSGKEAAVKAAWAIQATDYKNIGDAKTREAIQNVLKASGSSSVAELREFAERYAAFQEKYSAWELENFLEWDLVPAPAHISDVNHNVDNTALIAIISVITIVSVSSIAVLLVIKKRKHN